MDPTSLQPVPFEERYERRNQLWLDGPHGGWVAFDRLLHREVILNVPYRSKDNERFVDTAQLRARLRHPNLIPIYEFGLTYEGEPFFTEPHLQTVDLGQFDQGDGTLLKRGRFLIQVCQALEFLHGNELLHLDLNPGNVLITQPFEEVFLVRGHPSLPAAQPAARIDTVSDALGGTPAYMAPEQADPARFGRVTAATDIYGLGGILYYILYADPPNQAASTSGRRSSHSDTSNRSCVSNTPHAVGTLGYRVSVRPQARSSSANT